MKRRISVVIAFALSFLMMFSPIAKAEGIKVQIPVQTSESDELELVIKIPPAKTNKAVYSSPQEKVITQVLQGEEQMSKTEEKKCAERKGCGECSVDNIDGRWLDVLRFGSYILRNCVECVE